LGPRKAPDRPRHGQKNREKFQIELDILLWEVGDLLIEADMDAQTRLVDPAG
jgi:hypothetical protein